MNAGCLGKAAGIFVSGDLRPFRVRRNPHRCK